MAIVRKKVYQDEFSLTTDGSFWQTLRIYDFANNTTVKIDLQIVCRQTDGSNMASFRRVALLFTQNGALYSVDPMWHSIETIKTSRGIDIRYTLFENKFILQVKNGNAANPFRWVGKVQIIQVK